LKSLVVLVGVLFCVYFNANAQLPIETYFQVGKDYVVNESTIWEFETISKDSTLFLENRARDYLNTLNPEVDNYKTASVYQYIINANHHLRREDKALTFLYKLLALPKFKTSKGAIHAHWDIFITLKNTENYTGQLEQLDILENLGKKHNFYRDTGPKNLGKTKADVFFNAGFFEDAKSYILKNIIKDSLSVGPLKYAVINNDLAYIYEALDKPDSVLHYRQLALASLKSKRQIYYNTEYQSYIKDYILLHDLKYKKIYTENSLAFAKSFLENALENHHGEIHTSIFACHFLAEYFFNKKNYENALSYINQALSLSKSRLILRKLHDLYILKSRILDKLEKEEMADKTLKEFKLIQSNQVAKNKTLDLIKFEVNQIEIEKEKAEISALENINKYNRTLYVLVFSFIILIIVAVAFYNTKQKNLKIKAAQGEVLIKLKDKEFLLRELNHRVKNNLALILSLVQFQSKQIKTEAYKQKFIHLKQRIMAISVAHEQFLYKSDNLEEEYYDLKGYLIKISNGLINVSPRFVNFNLEVSGVMVNIDTALPIGILVNELITNSLEHAVTEDPLAINLDILQDSDNFHLTYKDSGNEFKDSVAQESLGLKIIESMVEQLFGTLKREQSTYTITLKFKN
jgi:two-component sensor histidine kinase/small nuclear ribonucleoprotein (snRNP)-like protein